MKATSLFLSTLLIMLLSVNATAEQATYQIIFENLWNAEDHLSFPSNAHFSPVIAVSHNSNYSMYELNQQSSKGFENLAETGNTRVIKNEIKEAKDKKFIYDLAETKSLFPNPGANSLTFEVTVNQDNPLLSLATMIAPSPDWIVGVSSLNLFSGGGFINKLSIDLYATNAGTENGDRAGNFSINNAPTLPHDPISLLKNIPGLDKPFANIQLKKL